MKFCTDSTARCALRLLLPKLPNGSSTNRTAPFPPVAGAPLPQSPAGRSARNRNDAALREALEAVRQGGGEGEGEGGQGLRGAVGGALWATVLAMALLRAKYIVQRPAWVALEARAYAFLEARWPRGVALSPASAIMKVATLL